MEDITVPESFKWMVCHDGSLQSVEALKITRWSLMDEKKDKVVVAHCWSAAKNEYLPMDMKLDFIKDKSDTDCIALGDRWTFDGIEMVEGGKSAKELLNESAEKHQAHVAVVGYHGRKGEKADPTIMGSAVQFMGINSSVPLFIVKDPIARKTKENKAFRFAACCDGSAQSLKALTYIAKMRQPQDSIEIIVCEQANIDSTHVRDSC